MINKMKTISLWKISSTQKAMKIKLDELYLKKNTDNELHVACLYNLPSYRTGIGGWLVTFFCHYFVPKTYVLSSLIKQCRWISDADIFSRTISYINRLLPFLNFGTWNAKKHFLFYNRNNSIFKHGGDNNKSLSGMFNFCDPFFDSGCAIISNVSCHDTDFVAFDRTKPNRGILWSYFINDQILVMTISTDGNADETMDEMQKIFETQKTLADKFVCKNTYIIGDFKREIIFDMSDGFKIMSIEGEETSFLIYDYIYTPFFENNLLKINSVILSSPVSHNKEKEVNPVMSPIQEIEPVVVVSTSPTPCNTPSGETIDEQPTNNNDSLAFPYIIFNYFSSGKTSPPLSASPASLSSDDGWSKV